MISYLAADIYRLSLYDDDKIKERLNDATQYGRIFEIVVLEEILRLRAEVERLQKLDDISAKAHNANLLEMAEMRAVITQLKTERLILARLASDDPEFRNPLHDYDARKVRDRVLRDALEAK